jgi:hypothetical protein
MLILKPTREIVEQPAGTLDVACRIGPDSSRFASIRVTARPAAITGSYSASRTSPGKCNNSCHCPAAFLSSSLLPFFLTVVSSSLSNPIIRSGEECRHSNFQQASGHRQFKRASSVADGLQFSQEGFCFLRAGK